MRIDNNKSIREKPQVEKNPKQMRRRSIISKIGIRRDYNKNIIIIYIYTYARVINKTYLYYKLFRSDQIEIGQPNFNHNNFYYLTYFIYYIIIFFYFEKQERCTC